MAAVVASPLSDIVIAKVDCAIEGILTDGGGCGSGGNAPGGPSARGPARGAPAGAPQGAPGHRWRRSRASPARDRIRPAATVIVTGVPDVDDPVPGEHDVDRDGLSDAEEVALGSGPRASDTDRDGVRDQDEYERGTDPTRGVAPLTDDNRMEPWVRVGMTEDEWREFEEAVLEEVNPDGLEGFLSGPAVGGVTLDENGELDLIKLSQSSVGGGFVRGISRLLGGGGRVLSAGQAAARRRFARSRLGARSAGAARRAAGRSARRTPAGTPSSPGDRARRAGRPEPPHRGFGHHHPQDARDRHARDTHSTGPPEPGGSRTGALIARQLGGSGSDSRNLLTLFQSRANTPAMSGLESRVRAAVEAGETVRYRVTPSYRGAEAVPRAVTLSAAAAVGFGST